MPLDGLAIAVAFFVVFCAGFWIGGERMRHALLTPTPRASVDPIRVRLRIVRGANSTQPPTTTH